ncbi:MAG: CoA transferase [Polaromonas sp.]|uniref:CoA transferase n=1 Tax=Polaromonas sp. TaxID=1869339 RepID=UPI002736A871|nr:CoA transferase [Polaromonas sp.]MDP2817016.1 CoA transferase [Polaromonas sp.]
MPSPHPSFLPLQDVRILSLALNLPGPAALMRCRRMGATCLKLEPPAGDPMGLYNPAAYAELHEGVKVLTADLKTEGGQKVLQRELAKTDVLLTSFRPSAIEKLGLGWKKIHTLNPALSHVAIVGAPGALGEAPGHDLTYMADNDLVAGLELPPTLYADMGGSVMASEAVLQAVLRQREPYAGTGDPHPQGVFLEVALSEAASYLGLPRAWGLTKPGAAVGGGHAGYRVYPCKNGRVAVAALEPHFAASLCAAAGVAMKDMATMFAPSTHEAVAAFFLSHTCGQLDKLAVDEDIPMHTLPA